METIDAARSLPGQKHGAYGVDFASIAELLRVRGGEHPDREFLVFFGEGPKAQTRWSYLQFADRVEKAASVLWSRHRLAPGDRVATLLYNHPLAVVTYFACWMLGAVVVPINVEESDERVRFILENSGAKLLVTMKEYVPKAKASAGAIPLLLAEGQAPEGTLESLLVNAKPLATPAGATLHGDALIVYTSGTTGMPKGVLLTQYNLLADARAISEWHGIGESDRMMCVLPIHHVNGIVVTLCTPLYAGAGVVLHRRFSAANFWKIAAEEKVAIVSVVPTLLHFLFEKNEEIGRYDLSAFRHFICGAGPLTVELASRFEHRFSKRIVHGYGLSETTCYSCFLPVDLTAGEHQDWIQAHGFPSIGVPIPSNEMAIHDSAGQALAAGQRGEIVIRGHNVMKEYYGNPAANEAAFTHGWFRSGDEGFFLLDPKGRPFFFIIGRIKELIARGGVKFAPLEIDEVLNSIPGVRRGIAVGFENDAYGEEVGAYVELEPGAALTEKDVIAACRRTLSFAKTPKVVQFGRDIPFTSTGKIQRIRLKPLYAEYKSTQFRET